MATLKSSKADVLSISPFSEQMKHQLSTAFSVWILETSHEVVLIIHLSQYNTGRDINFFSDSHLAPKSYKVVANSKKVGHHFPRQTKLFFYTVIILEIKLGKRSLTCYKVDTRMDDVQCPSSPKSKMVSSYQSRCMCCVLETNVMRKFAVDLSLQIFLIHYISR